MNLNLRFDRPKVIWRQVADQVRDKILSGELAQGIKLPSTAQLAVQSGTDVKTVHRAMSELVREGLLTRTRKIGTYVSKREAAMSTIGIYYAGNIENRHSFFLQALNAELQKQAHHRHMATRIWMDLRPKEQQDVVLPEIEAATRDREIQGLIITIADHVHSKWFSKLKVPVAYIGGNMPTSVDWDVLNFVKISVRELRRQGCRSAGCITPYNRSEEAFCRAFFEECMSNGIATNESWVSVVTEKNGPNGVPFVTEEQFEEYGYKCFNEIWSQPSKPEGVIVFPDGVARGVIMASLAQHVRIPQDLKLIVHRNEGVRLFCPVPATFITSSVKEACLTLLDRLDDAFNGRQTTRTDLHYEVERSVGEGA